MLWWVTTALAAPELCNGIDDDSDGQIDEGPVAISRDEDGDGYGADDTFTLVVDCASIPGDQISDISDCDDGDLQIHPGAIESCDAVDDDCDGLFDDGACTGEVNTEDEEAWMITTSQLTWAAAKLSCDSQGWHLATPDSDQQQEGIALYTDPYDTIFWLGLTDGVTEGQWYWVDGSTGYYNNWDYGEPNDYQYGEDCAVLRASGAWDDFDCEQTHAYVCERSCEYRYWHVDSDGDGLGETYDGDDECETYDGRVANTLDCNDDDPNEPSVWYIDNDGDGYGAEGFIACGARDAIRTGGDCDDTQEAVYPGAEDLPSDGLDANCDGADGNDIDGDGLSEEEELARGTDPDNPDSDNDGVLDGVDPNPLDAGGVPDSTSPVPSAGCGCAASRPSSALLLAGLGLFTARRARTPR